MPSLTRKALCKRILANMTVKKVSYDVRRVAQSEQIRAAKCRYISITAKDNRLARAAANSAGCLANANQPAHVIDAKSWSRLASVSHTLRFPHLAALHRRQPKVRFICTTVKVVCHALQLRR